MFSWLYDFKWRFFKTGFQHKKGFMTLSAKFDVYFVLHAPSDDCSNLWKDSVEGGRFSSFLAFCSRWFLMPKSRLRWWGAKRFLFAGLTVFVFKTGVSSVNIRGCSCEYIFQLRFETSLCFFHSFSPVLVLFKVWNFSCGLNFTPSISWATKYNYTFFYYVSILNS